MNRWGLLTHKSAFNCHVRLTKSWPELLLCSFKNLKRVFSVNKTGLTEELLKCTGCFVIEKLWQIKLF